MRIKKGFTLAEILIVLMVIGVIATMTIPTLLGAVQDQQYKTAYKKAFNQISGIMAMEAVGGSLPAKNKISGDNSATNLSPLQIIYKSLVTNMSYKGFYTLAPDNGLAADLSGMYTGLKIHGQMYGSGEGNKVNEVSGDTGLGNLWIVADDNMAYLPLVNGTESDTVCGKKTDINGLTANPYEYKEGYSPCFKILVDVNGLNKSPNLIQWYTKTSEGSSTTNKTQYQNDGTPTPRLTNDQYYIYIGSDGATAGNPNTTLTGRILSDTK